MPTATRPRGRLIDASRDGTTPRIYPPPELLPKLVPDLPESAEFTKELTRAWHALQDGQVSVLTPARRPERRAFFQARRAELCMAEKRNEKNKVEPWRDPHAKPYIQIDNITKKFGDFVAVNNVSLKIYQGEIFCLLGGSGCGKSTLLRMLAGFETPTVGQHLARRAGHGGHPALRAPGEHDVPVLCAVPAHDRGEEHRASAWSRSACRRARSPPASRRCSAS